MKSKEIILSIYDNHAKLDFSDVLIVPRVSTIKSRSEIILDSAKLENLLGIKTNGIVAANMDGVGTIEMASALKSHGCMTALHKFYDNDTLLDFFSTEMSSHAFYSMGMSDDELNKFKHFYKNHKSSSNPLKISIDVANGYMEKFSIYCYEVMEHAPDAIVMAGNVVDTHGLKNLSPADIVKVGIGQGSNCLTRTQTGIGYPQFSAVYDIVHYARPSTIICSDGGCACPGDIVKAISAGANMVMLGGMLAGTDQGDGDVIEISGKKYVEFYGMSSITAQKKHNGGLRDYRSSEGRTTLVPYKGDVNNIISNILGGIRSACAYVGANSIDQLHEKATFIKVNSILNRSMDQFTISN